MLTHLFVMAIILKNMTNRSEISRAIDWYAKTLLNNSLTFLYSQFTLMNVLVKVKLKRAITNYIKVSGSVLSHQDKSPPEICLLLRNQCSKATI